MEAIAKEGAGAVVIMRPGTRAESLTQMIEQSITPDHVKTDIMTREYGLGAQILVDLGIKDVVLLTNSPQHHLIGLEGYGLKVVREQAF